MLNMATYIGNTAFFTISRVKTQGICYCRKKVLVSYINHYSSVKKKSSAAQGPRRPAPPTRQCTPSQKSDNMKSVPAFVDFLQIQAIGGPGGQGLPKYGGFGGTGGKVVVVARKKTKSLRELLIKYPLQICKAGGGENSDKFHLLGDRGADLHLEVPLGVIVHKPDGVIEDLNNDSDSCVAAEGGKGGDNNTKFLGLKGPRNLIGLELKLLADIGLVGFPNAGKSTFLKAISNANPKISAYPFTTVTPQIGMMKYDDGRMISVADLPGLIEGANQNFGMGFKFLRHVERTKLLLYILDINQFQLSPKHPERSPFETLLLLIQELEEYGHGMLEKPTFLALNKMDTDLSGSKTDKLIDLVKNLPDSLDQVGAEFHPNALPKFDDIFRISAVKKENTVLVKNRIREVMDEYAERQRVKELEEKKVLMNLRDNDSLSVYDEHLKTTFV